MGIKKFKVNYLYSEYLETKIAVGQNPIPLLTIRQSKVSDEAKKTFCDTYLDGVDFEDDEEHLDFISKRYPESAEDIV